MKIKVTQEDITTALNAPLQTDMVECCPIAQALIRLFPGQHVFVTSYCLKIGGTWYGLHFGDSVHEVIALNRHEWGRVRPFSFEATQVIP